MFSNAPALPPSYVYTYGTSGFRLPHHLLDPVMYRVCLLAALRSQKCNGKWIGVMVTASHNPADDNGVKVAEPNGDMLIPEWEEHATKLANSTPADLQKVYEEIKKSEGIDASVEAKILIARDTRESGIRLVNCFKSAADAVKANLKDFGVFTTPQLHYVTRCINVQGTKDDYGVPTEEGYYHKFAKAFNSLVEGLPATSTLYVDGANGVGAPKAKALFALIGEKSLKVELVGTSVDEAEKLNKDCGADYVKVEQKAPPFITSLTDKRCASLDGDADRVVFYFEEDGHFRLLDGDKISALAAGYISELIHILDLKVTLGVVQTAYANGSSTRYFDSVKVPTACTETGVKHLHHKAQEYDVGVYFESNGHGTVIFSDKLHAELAQYKPSNEDQKNALKILKGLTELINQAVGDAISDLLAVEAILRIRGWSFSKWNSLYTDLPSRQSKLKVKDRTVVTTRDAARVCVTPAGLQSVIDGHVSKFSNGRAFVRPSGTEDVIRVYAEASSQSMTDELASTICAAVWEMAGGVGEKPVIVKADA